MFHQDDRGLGQVRVVEDLLFVLVVPRPDPGDYQCPARSFDYVPLETMVMKRGVEEEGQVPRVRCHGCPASYLTVRKTYPDDLGRASGDQPGHLGQGRHRCVARGGHGQGAVGQSITQRLVDGHPHDQAVYEPGGERVPPADAIEDLEVLGHVVGIDRTTRPADRSPVVAAGRTHAPLAAGNDLEGGELGRHPGQQGGIAIDVRYSLGGAAAGDFEA